MFETTQKIVKKIKKENPLILNITNYVTMDFIANGLLSLGASPVMSCAKEEISDLVKIAKAVVINMGTLHRDFIELCNHACQAANQLNKPVIFDPVGTGASAYRTQTAKHFVENHKLAIIRGNAAEIMALAGSAANTKGVDSLEHSNGAIEPGKRLSKSYSTAVVISGETDFIIEHDRVNQSDRGSYLMPLITGTGCLLSAVVGAFHAVHNDRLEAATTATIFYTLSGEIAHQHAKNPGSFKQAFLDALHTIPTREQYDEKNH